MSGQLHVEKDAASVARRATEFIAARIAEAKAPFAWCSRADRRRARPMKFWAATRRSTGGCVELFFGDERFVPPESRDSNYRMVRETLLAGGRVRPRGLYEIPTDGTLEKRRRALRGNAPPVIWRSSTLAPRQPLFDLVHSGLAMTADIASLLPASRCSMNGRRGRPPCSRAATSPASRSPIRPWNQAAQSCFLVTGAAKGDAPRRARAGDRALPAVGGLHPRARSTGYWMQPQLGCKVLALLACA